MSNTLTTRKLDLYREAVKAHLVANPAGSDAELLALLESVDLAEKAERYGHVVDSLKLTFMLQAGIGGGFVSVDTVTTAGTTYVAGTTFPLTEAGTDGVDGLLTIETVDTGGEILTVSVTGSGYVTPAVDLSGAGNGLGVVALVANTYGAFVDVNTLEDMLALI